MGGSVIVEEPTRTPICPMCAEKVISMQRFVAELSTPIEKADFEKSWRSDLSLDEKQLETAFTFDSRRVLAIIDWSSSERWASASFYRTFSAAIRRVNGACNIRWL
jgi:hypothetical protein